MSILRAHTDELTMVEEAAILTLWKLKLNTFEIATAMHRTEWQITNRLLRLREEQKQPN